MHPLSQLPEKTQKRSYFLRATSWSFSLQYSLVLEATSWGQWVALNSVPFVVTQANLQLSSFTECLRDVILVKTATCEWEMEFVERQRDRLKVSMSKGSLISFFTNLYCFAIGLVPDAVLFFFFFPSMCCKVIVGAVSHVKGKVAGIYILKYGGYVH